MSAPSAASPAASADLRPAALSDRPARSAWQRARSRWPRRRCASCATTTWTSSPARCSRCCGCSSSAPRSAATARSRAATLDYRAYIAPGVMAQAAMFIAIFYGLSVIWERDVGQLQRLLATPLSRSSIVLGKAAGACVRALVQARAAAGGARRRGHRRALERHAACSARSRCSPSAPPHSRACRCCSPP